MKKSSVNPSSSSDLRYGPDILSLLDGGSCESRRSNDLDNRREKSDSRGRSGRRSRSHERGHRDDHRRRRRSRSNSDSRHRRSRSPHGSKRVKTSFLEDITQQFPQLKNELAENKIMENNMIALQEFGMQQNYMQPAPQFMPQFHPNYVAPDQYGMVPSHYPIMHPALQPIPMDVMHPIMPVEPVPEPSMEITPLIPSTSNFKVEHNNVSFKKSQNADTSQINIDNVTKKAFEEGNIGLVDILKHKMLKNTKKLEATNISIKMKQVHERSKRALKMIEDIEKGNFILPFLFKPTTKDVPLLKDDLAKEMKSSLIINDTNLKFSWQTKSEEALLSNPCKNVRKNIMPICRSIPMDFIELSQRASNRAKIEKNAKAQAAKKIVQNIIAPLKEVRKFSTAIQTEPLTCLDCLERINEAPKVCVECVARANIFIKQVGVQVIEEDLEMTNDPDMFKIILTGSEVRNMTHDQRTALSNFCRMFNIRNETLVKRLDSTPRRSRSINHSPHSSHHMSHRSISPHREREFDNSYPNTQNKVFINFDDFEPSRRERSMDRRDLSGSPRQRSRPPAMARLGHKVPSDSPREAMIRQSRYFHEDDDYEDMRYQSEGRFIPDQRSRSPIIRQRSPLQDAYISPSHRSLNRDYISPPRDILIDRGIDNYRDRRDERYESPPPPRMRNASPPRRGRNESPLRFENGVRVRADHELLRTHDEDYGRDPSRSPPSRGSSNWFTNTRPDISLPSTSVRDTRPRRGRY